MHDFFFSMVRGGTETKDPHPVSLSGITAARAMARDLARDALNTPKGRSLQQGDAIGITDVTGIAVGAVLLADMAALGSGAGGRKR